MASVSNLNAGTNLGLSDLYDQLQTAEQANLTPITTQQTSYKAKLSAWGIVQTAAALKTLLQLPQQSQQHQHRVHRHAGQ